MGGSLWIGGPRSLRDCVVDLDSGTPEASVNTSVTIVVTVDDPSARGSVVTVVVVVLVIPLLPLVTTVDVCVDFLLLLLLLLLLLASPVLVASWVVLLLPVTRCANPAAAGPRIDLAAPTAAAPGAAELLLLVVVLLLSDCGVPVIPAGFRLSPPLPPSVALLVLLLLLSPLPPKIQDDRPLTIPAGK